MNSNNNFFINKFWLMIANLAKSRKKYLYIFTFKKHSNIPK